MTKLTEPEQRIIDRVQSGQDIVTPPCEAKQYCKIVEKLALTVADTELALASAYTSHLNQLTNLSQRIELVQIIQDRFRSAQKLYDMLAQFGFHAEEHLERMQTPLDDSGAVCSQYGLSMLNYPLKTWSDVAAVTYLVGQAIQIELLEGLHSSYRPWSQCAAELLPIEEKSVETAAAIISASRHSREERNAMEKTLQRWYETIGDCYTAWLLEEQVAQAMGIRRLPSSQLTENWRSIVETDLKDLGFEVSSKG